MDGQSEDQIRQEQLDLLKMLDAQERAVKEQAFLDKKYSLIQKAFLLCKAKIRMLGGSNRSGKTEVGADDLVIRSTGIIPNELVLEYPVDLIRIGDYWASALSFKVSKNVSEDKIFKSLPRSYVRKYHTEARILDTVNGSKIGFMSADAGRDKYQGTSRIGVWNDEEHPEDICDEEYMRGVDCKGWMSHTFTPVEGLTWMFSKVYKRAALYYFTRNKHGISEEPLMVHAPEEIKLLKDRELVCIPNTSGDADENIVAFQMSIYDNPFLDDYEIQMTERKYQYDLPKYNARVLGKFTKISGFNVFDTGRLSKLQGSLRVDYKQGEVVDGKLELNKRGRLTMFVEKKPFGKGHYVVGGDAAEGLMNGDYSCAQILDHQTFEQVAVWHGKCSPEEFAKILVDLGKFYNNAIVAPERNFHGFGIVNAIRDVHKYQYLFSEYNIAERTLKGSVENPKKTYGWDTNGKTKPIMIQTLGRFIRDGHIRINDFNTIDELISYVYDDGKTEAMGGCYDDRVMALAIALQVAMRKQIPLPKLEVTKSDKINPVTGY